MDCSSIRSTVVPTVYNGVDSLRRGLSGTPGSKTVETITIDYNAVLLNGVPAYMGV
jgi:hypothetical protein